MSKYLRKFDSASAATSASNIVSPNITYVSDGTDSKLLMKDAGDDVSLQIEGETIPVLHFKETPVGPEMVDLGLSVKWAKCNLGATNPQDYGNFYAWGETIGYTGITAEKQFSSEDYKFGETPTKYNSTDGLTTLEAVDDAATVLYGSDYRIPTETEIRELLAGTTREVISISGINGVKFTSTQEGNTNSIFIPLAGYCGKGEYEYENEYTCIWSSTRHNNNVLLAWSLDCDISAPSSANTNGRYYGFTVRPVCSI